MTETREFALGDILSITTGRLVSRRLIGGVYDILNFMTGDNLMTHQLPRAMRACQPLLLKQHPQLAAIVVPKLTPANYLDWLVAQEVHYGDTLLVERVHEWEWESRDPLQEAIEMVGEDRVIAIDPPLPNGP